MNLGTLVTFESDNAPTPKLTVVTRKGFQLDTVTSAPTNIDVPETGPGVSITSSDTDVWAFSFLSEQLYCYHSKRKTTLDFTVITPIAYTVHTSVTNNSYCLGHNNIPLCALDVKSPNPVMLVCLFDGVGSVDKSPALPSFPNNMPGTNRKITSRPSGGDAHLVVVDNATLLFWTSTDNLDTWSGQQTLMVASSNIIDYVVTTFQNGIVCVLYKCAQGVIIEAIDVSSGNGVSLDSQQVVTYHSDLNGLGLTASGNKAYGSITAFDGSNHHHHGLVYWLGMLSLGNDSDSNIGTLTGPLKGGGTCTYDPVTKSVYTCSNLITTGQTKWYVTDSMNGDVARRTYDVSVMAPQQQAGPP